MAESGFLATVGTFLAEAAAATPVGVMIVVVVVVAAGITYVIVTRE